MSPLRVRPVGALAERLLGGRSSTGVWDALVEEVSVRALVRAHTATLNGGSAPPWIRDGWFHAWLLHPTPSSQDLAHRLMGGGGEDTVERLNLERALVSRIRGGCERVVAGSTLGGAGRDAGHPAAGLDGAGALLTR